VVASVHGGPCTPDSLDDRYRTLAATGAARLKLVPTARALDECVAVRDVLARAARDRRRLACFALGGPGRISRILAPSWGSWATYGTRAGGETTAPGQFPVEDLVDVFDVRSIGPGTRLYGLVGGDLGRSPSPAMHADALRAAGLDARYLPFDAPDLVTFDRFRVAMTLNGVGVTVPHKRAAAARCMALDEAAGAAGAVNTVRFEGPAWVGSNTDATGLRREVARHLDVAGLRGVVVGAGGTGRVAASVLGGLGAQVAMVNRDPRRGAEAARSVGATYEPWDRLAVLEPEIWVQATPLGRGDGFRLPVDRDRTRLVVDFVYADPPTATVATARECGVPVVDGLDLLSAQGADQFEILTGAPADQGRMRRVAAAWLAGRGGAAAPDQAPG
jgi:3-dehydroquinate dehydratase/shikimate dehydrogenase